MNNPVEILPSNHLLEIKNLADVNKAVKIAIALGAEISAIPGSVFFETIVILEDGRKQYLGHYPTEEKAFMAIAAYILIFWRIHLCVYPWSPEIPLNPSKTYEEFETEYLANATVQEIVDFYFLKSPESYRVNKKIISDIESIR